MNQFRRDYLDLETKSSLMGDPNKRHRKVFETFGVRYHFFGLTKLILHIGIKYLTINKLFNYFCHLICNAFSVDNPKGSMNWTNISDTKNGI